MGTVGFEFTVSAVGEVLALKVTKSSGYPRLDRTAIDHWRSCKFKAGTKDYLPV